MKVLIIGYGSIGKRHCQILKDCFQVETLEVVTHQVSEFKTYLTLEQVERIEDYDYYIIASETYQHYQQLRFLEEKIKNKVILVEKPVFHQYYDFQARNNQVYIAYNLRFDPVIEAIKNKLIGQKILYANVMVGQYLPTWRPGADYRRSYSASKEKGGGVLLDLSHEIDYIQWLFGQIIQVEALNTKISGLEIDSDDTVTAIGVTEKQVFVNFSMDYISKIPFRNVLVHTDEITLVGDLVQHKLVVNSINNQRQDESFVVNRDYTYQKMHEAILHHYGLNVCNLPEALQVLRTVEKVQEASKGWSLYG